MVFSLCVWTLKPRLPVVRATRREDRVPLLPRDLSFIWHPTVIVMSMVTLTSSFSFFPVATYLPIYVESLADPFQSEVTLAIFNAASVVGQVLVGWLSDRFDSALIIAGLGVGSGITSLTAWGFANTLPKVFGFVIVYGMFSGICSVWSAVGREVAGEFRRAFLRRAGLQQAFLRDSFTSCTALTPTLSPLHFLALALPPSLTLSPFCLLARIFHPSLSFSTFPAFTAGDSQISTMIFSIFGVGRGIASISGPLLASALYDESKKNDAGTWGRYGFAGVMSFCGAMAITSAVLAGGLRVTKRMKTQ